MTATPAPRRRNTRGEGSRHGSSGQYIASGDLRVSLDELREIDGQPISLAPVIVESDSTAWTIQIYQFYAQLLKPCPRCNKVCPWIITRSIRPHSAIPEFFLGYAACPCPDDQIRKAVAETVAQILVDAYRKELAERASAAEAERALAHAPREVRCARPADR